MVSDVWERSRRIPSHTGHFAFTRLLKETEFCAGKAEATALRSESQPFEEVHPGLLCIPGLCRRVQSRSRREEQTVPACASRNASLFIQDIPVADCGQRESSTGPQESSRVEAPGGGDVNRGCGGRRLGPGETPRLLQASVQGRVWRCLVRRCRAQWVGQVWS